MSSVTATSAFDALGLSGTTTKKKAGGDLGQEDFLNLMIAQLKNQDPSKPMDNGQFLGQIAQFGTVSGLNDLKASFADFAGSLYSNQALQAAGLVGHSVLAPTGAGQLAAGGAIDGAVDLPSSAAQVTVNIYTAGGQLVRQVSLGTQAGGLAGFHWDGLATDGTPAAPGIYKVTASAQIGGQDTAVDTLIASKVQSVNLGKDASSLTLNLSGLGSVDFSTVREIM
jgi:flagellar basal-body rod modification protein FlgD